MPKLLTTSSTLMCPHGGTVSIISANTRAKAGGSFVARASDTYLIAGCVLNVAGAPHPCVSVRWVQPAARVKVMGDFVVNAASTGLCVAADQAVQGTVLVLMTQPRVDGT